jgi:NADP-dependent 3-hydroxy acid dehydrogenase YdfG
LHRVKAGKRSSHPGLPGHQFAVRAISEGLPKESDKIRCTRAYPGVVESELEETISDEVARERMKSYRKTAVQPDDYRSLPDNKVMLITEASSG